MMLSSFLQLLRKRRSIRSFSSEKISQDKLDLLKEAVLRSPSSRGLDPASYIFVDDIKLLSELAEVKAHGSALIENAALAIIITADPEISDVWVEDASIAAAVLHFQACDLGLGSCWVQIRKRRDEKGVCSEERVRRIMNISDHSRILAIVAVGNSSELKKGHDHSSLKYERISCNKVKR